MDILEIVSTSLGVIVLAAVFFSKTKDVWNDKGFRSALKKLLEDSSDFPNRSEAYLNLTEHILNSAIGSSTEHHKRIVIYLNSSLISAISRIYEEVRLATPEQKKSKTIVSMMLQEKLRGSSKYQIILILSLLLNCFLSVLEVTPFSYFLFVIGSLLILAMHIDQKLIDYRVKNGWYGKNEFEAKEIIKFIISHSNKDDFNDSGGLKRVIPLPEIESEEKTVDVRGGATL